MNPWDDLYDYTAWRASRNALSRRYSAPEPKPYKARSTGFQNGGKGIWRTATEYLDMWDMDISHLRNALILSKAYGYDHKIKELREVIACKEAGMYRIGERPQDPFRV